MITTSDLLNRAANVPARVRDRFEKECAAQPTKPREQVAKTFLKVWAPAIAAMSATPTDEGRDLLFIAERCIYNPAIDDNVPLGSETFRMNSFSEWFATKRRAGWRFCS